MNKYLSILVALVATLFAANAMAFTSPPSPAPKSWISDPSHVLSDAAHARLDQKLRQINQSSANELAALILPTLDGADIADVGDLTSKAWGVGKKDLDNGVLVVLAMREHKSRISTGKGVEGDLPDLKCNDILNNARPYLRRGDIEGALGFIFDSSASQIANHKAEAAKLASQPPTTSTAQGASTSTTRSNSSCTASGAGLGGGGLLVIAILALAAIFFISRARAAQRRRMEEMEDELQRQRDEVWRNHERAARLARENAEREASRQAEEARLNAQREAERVRQSLNVPTPVVPVPVTRPSSMRPTAPVLETPQTPYEPISTAFAASALAAEVEAEERRERERQEETRRAREREEEERRARERREQEEADRRRREEESSSSSSSSSWDSGSSGSSWDSGSSGGGWDSGGSGGFGGGDSGGGGSSSDW